MNLHNLSAGGWVLFAWCIMVGLAFIARMLTRNTHWLTYHVMLTAALWTWFIWLVTK